MAYKDKDLQRKFNREWVAKRKADWFQANGPCVKCSSWDKLELDHIDRTKKVSHSIWSWAIERRNEELSKCQILCHDCHWEKTKIDLGWGKHGIVNRYKGGCRCVECMLANTLYKRKQRAKRKALTGRDR